MEKSRIIRALIVGVMSAIAVVSTHQLNLHTWVLFMAWVSFFIFGKEPKQMALSFTQIVIGIGIGALLMLKSKFLTAYIGDAGLPIAVVVIIATFMYLVPRLKSLNTIPIYFMGLIIFFGTHPVLNFSEVGLVVLTVVTGFFFAWTTSKLESILANQHK
ncbi:hypothetical protein I215_13877 [Galbibacter marinus]|uniref:DUF1097 domain-containing protein n=1 Tax=Galbibacter marinus TaxID=555500 RepID=K2NZD7_9FLAO|nr:DUF1097 domain-containing protein [Galbibacter marinus]EKF54158.1 hypothetical protein I215_13877 [Galbibacter marinus]